jgi:hypothetical protein
VCLRAGLDAVKETFLILPGIKHTAPGHVSLSLIYIHKGLVLCPSCAPEKMDINQKGI